MSSGMLDAGASRAKFVEGAERWRWSSLGCERGKISSTSAYLCRPNKAIKRNITYRAIVPIAPQDRVWEQWKATALHSRSFPIGPRMSECPTHGASATCTKTW